MGNPTVFLDPLGLQSGTTTQHPPGPEEYDWWNRGNGWGGGSLQHAECCASGFPNAPGAGGKVVCCNEKKHFCSFLTAPTWVNVDGRIPPGSLVNRCAVEHERSHRNDTESCTGRPDGHPADWNRSIKGNDAAEAAEECEGLQIEYDCLQRQLDRDRCDDAADAGSCVTCLAGRQADIARGAPKGCTIRDSRGNPVRPGRGALGFPAACQ